MAIALVQTITEVIVSGGTSGSTGEFTATAGNLLTCAISQPGASSETYTTSGGGTWDDTIVASGTRKVQTAFCQNATGGATTVTVTSATSANYQFVVHEWSGAATTGQPETSSSITEPGTTNDHVSVADGTVIDTTVSCLVICNCLSGSGGSLGTTTPGSGYTEYTWTNNPTLCFLQYQIFASPVSNEQGAWTSGTARVGLCLTAAFKVAASASIYSPSDFFPGGNVNFRGGFFPGGNVTF
jgi:hypothetical protein